MITVYKRARTPSFGASLTFYGHGGHGRPSLSWLLELRGVPAIAPSAIMRVSMKTLLRIKGRRERKSERDSLAITEKDGQ